jgi:hypothetical protein
MHFKLTMGAAALALGTVLVSTLAFAQQQGVSGYSANGGVVAIHPYRHPVHTGPLYNFAPRRAQKHGVKDSGRLQSDGGL